MYPFSPAKGRVQIRTRFEGRERSVWRTDPYPYSLSYPKTRGNVRKSFKDIIHREYFSLVCFTIAHFVR